MSETKVPRPRNVLLAEFEGLSKEDASQALRDAGGDLDRARALVRRRRANPDDEQPQRDDDEAASLALARQLQAEDAATAGPRRVDERPAKRARAPQIERVHAALNLYFKAMVIHVST